MVRAEIEKFELPAQRESAGAIESKVPCSAAAERKCVLCAEKPPFATLACPRPPTACANGVSRFHPRYENRGPKV